jgi:hypothetical protein
VVLTQELPDETAQSEFTRALARLLADVAAVPADEPDEPDDD